MIPTVSEVEESDNSKSKNAENDFSKISFTTKCYKCQGYGHVAANCPSPFKIVINDRVLIKASKSDSIVSLKATHVIKKFTVTCHFDFPALLPTPPSLPPLLPTPTIVTCFGYQLLPPLLLTPSSFLLWPMLGTKSKISIELIPITDQYQVIESASSASHVHKPTEISDKIAQKIANHEIRADVRNRLNTFKVSDVQKLHAYNSNSFQILIKLNDNIYIIDLSLDFGISSTSNINCLVNYKGLDVIPLVDEPFHEPIFESPFLSPLPDFYHIQHVKLINS